MKSSIGTVQMYSYNVFCTSRWADVLLKPQVHKIENFFDSDFGICVISLLVMH
jgi:hypothetical protein